VVYVGETVPGSLEAVSQIRAAGLPLKFVTSTTRRPLGRIVNDFASFGLRVDPIRPQRSRAIIWPTVTSRRFWWRTRISMRISPGFRTTETRRSSSATRAHFSLTIG